MLTEGYQTVLHFFYTNRTLTWKAKTMSFVFQTPIINALWALRNDTLTACVECLCFPLRSRLDLNMVCLSDHLLGMLKLLWKIGSYFHIILVNRKVGKINK